MKIMVHVYQLKRMKMRSERIQSEESVERKSVERKSVERESVERKSVERESDSTYGVLKNSETVRKDKVICRI